jgi:hypothetical protein
MLALTPSFTPSQIFAKARKIRKKRLERKVRRKL